MSRFLSDVASRALGDDLVARPRVRSMFEPHMPRPNETEIEPKQGSSPVEQAAGGPIERPDTNRSASPRTQPSQSMKPNASSRRTATPPQVQRRASTDVAGNTDFSSGSETLRHAGPAELRSATASNREQKKLPVIGETNVPGPAEPPLAGRPDSGERPVSTREPQRPPRYDTAPKAAPGLRQPSRSSAEAPVITPLPSTRPSDPTSRQLPVSQAQNAAADINVHEALRETGKIESTVVSQPARASPPTNLLETQHSTKTSEPGFQPQPETTVEVHIGRIEIQVEPPVVDRTVKRPDPPMQLNDFLGRRR